MRPNVFNEKSCRCIISTPLFVWIKVLSIWPLTLPYIDKTLKCETCGDLFQSHSSEFKSCHCPCTAYSRKSTSSEAMMKLPPCKPNNRPRINLWRMRRIVPQLKMFFIIRGQIQVSRTASTHFTQVSFPPWIHRWKFTSDDTHLSLSVRIQQSRWGRRL